MCVCVTERERERDRRPDRQTYRQIDRQRERKRYCHVKESTVFGIKISSEVAMT